MTTPNIAALVTDTDVRRAYTICDDFINRHGNGDVSELHGNQWHEMLRLVLEAVLQSKPGDGGRVPEREAIWLIERNCQPPQYYGTAAGFTSDAWRARRFNTEREAHDCWRTMTLFRDESRPVEHVFINKPAEDEASPFTADDEGVNNFARAMSAKLAFKRAEGYHGWNDKALCSQEYLSALLRMHVDKGDPVDVANFAMMLHQRGERISPAPAGAALDDAGLRESATNIWDCATVEGAIRVLRIYTETLMRSVAASVDKIDVEQNADDPAMPLGCARSGYKGEQSIAISPAGSSNAGGAVDGALGVTAGETATSPPVAAASLTDEQLIAELVSRFKGLRYSRRTWAEDAADIIALVRENTAAPSHARGE